MTTNWNTEGVSGEIAIDCYLAHNFGDDLFLATLLGRYPDQRFCMIADDSYAAWPKRFKNLRVIFDESAAEQARSGLSRRLNREKLVLRKIKFFSRCAALVAVGGSIFMQPKYRSAFITFIATRHAILARKKIYAATPKTFVCGANFGPYSRNSYKNSYEMIFRSYCTDVCFRDRYSASLFSALDNVRYAPDILLATKIPDSITKRRQVLFSLVDLSGNPQKFHELSERGQDYDDWVLAATRYYHDAGYHIVYSSFCSHEGDERAVNRLMARAEKYGIKVEASLYTDNVDDVLRHILSSEIVVGTRFHATILGFVAGAKVLPVIYSQKTSNILEDMNFDIRNSVDLRDFEARDIAACKRVQEGQVIDVHEQSLTANDHFSKLDAFLGCGQYATMTEQADAE